jgi:hypothetical protein
LWLENWERREKQVVKESKKGEQKEEVFIVSGRGRQTRESGRRYGPRSWLLQRMINERKWEKVWAVVVAVAAPADDQHTSLGVYGEKA